MFPDRTIRSPPGWRIDVRPPDHEVNGVETGSKITATGGTDTAIDGGTVVNRDLWTTWLPPTPQRATFQNKGAGKAGK